MQLKSIRASSRSTHIFGMLKASTGIGPEPWARLSICMSLRQRGIPNPDEYNMEGTVFQATRLFPSNERLYHALIINRLIRDGLDPESYLADMTRAHLNRGAISLKQRIDGLFDVYKFIREMDVDHIRDGRQTT